MTVVATTREPLGRLDFTARSCASTWLVYSPLCQTVCLLLALSWGGITCAWGNAHIIALLTLAGGLFYSFVDVEYWRKDNAIIPLRLLRRRSIIAAILFVLSWRRVVNVSYIPLWFRIVDGVSAVESSILLIPFMLSVVGGFIPLALGPPQWDIPHRLSTLAQLSCRQILAF